ncbi:GntR family transcriptional regulator [Methylobacterium brachythecii]|uniref:GntR family transcriptional regulator n=1 Tax=Methylobacterium brachythecii TaxID=1176177 RepID=A0A7W6AMA5_9HYPH|nr:GntR family transcriptional regulator [Methylobacterium brachythecii]MBB3905233.1 GntR family transcriptional regulator [Methylobacterium brachythecii]GLS47024.1 GntR family transcriptional regulator [Methylobacterium brachythecii]
MERTGDDPTTAAGRSEIGYRPLYRQVYDKLLKRLADAVWQPGQMLPSEGQLAVELGVSQGTVRKALDALTADSLLIRRQGRGTFVAEHDDQQSVFRFFKLRPDRAGAGMPTSRVITMTETSPNADERENLDLLRTAQVVRIERLRYLDGRLCIAETISVPAVLFPGFARMEIPNTLYSLYATRFGITIATANERLKAISLDARQAQLLETSTGTAALEIDRIAVDLEDRPVEWRLSICLTQLLHYNSLLR